MVTEKGTGTAPRIDFLPSPPTAPWAGGRLGPAHRTEHLAKPTAVVASTVGGMTSEPDLTPAAQQLADRYARVLDLVQRCTRAIEEGNWVYLNDEAGELSVAADELSAAASATTRDESATNPDTLLAYVEAMGERPVD